jgi:ABC-type transporter Mla MlaB component
MDRTPRNCVKLHSGELKSGVTRADTGAVPGVNALNARAHQIMTTRKKQTPVRKRSRPRATPRRGRLDGPLLLAADCTVAQAETFKSALTARVRESEPVTIDVSALQRIDTAGLQLLAAFVRDRRTAGHAVAWRGHAAPLDTAAALLGLRDMLELPGGPDR